MPNARFSAEPRMVGGKFSQVPEGYSADKAYQDQEASGTVTVTRTSGAGKDGLTRHKSKMPYYKLVDRTPAPSNPAPAPNPIQSPVEAEATQAANVRLSKRAAEANAGTSAYENILLNRQGDATLLNDTSAVQDFKNAYQNNLTEELKAKAPSTLASKKAEIELADRQAADIEDSFSLNLGSY